MLNTINIPLDSPLDLSSYNTTVPKNEVSFSTKETLKYRNCLSNLRKTEKNGIITTAGADLRMENGRLKYNDIDLGISTRNAKHRFLTEKRELPKNFPGKYYGAYINDEVNAVVIFSEDNAQYYTSYFDRDTYELINTTVYPKSNKDSQTFGLPAKANYKLSDTDTAPARYYHLEITWTNNQSISACVVTLTKEANTGKIKETKSNTASVDFDTITSLDGHTYPRFTYMGEQKDAMVVSRGPSIDPNKPDRMLESIAVAFDDVDQRKRCTFNFGLFTSPDGEVEFVLNQWVPYIMYFGTLGVDADGKPLLTGEPIPIKFNNNDINSAAYIRDSNLFPFIIQENGVIGWSLVDPDHLPWSEYTSADDHFLVSEEDNPVQDNSAWKGFNHKRATKNIVWVNSISLENTQVIVADVYKQHSKLGAVGVDMNYTATTPYPYDLGNNWLKSEGEEEHNINPFPTGMVYTNLTENKGKYWDYGNGWSKYLAFTWALYRNAFTVTLPMFIVRGEDKSWIECADPMGKIQKHSASYVPPQNKDDLMWHNTTPGNGGYPLNIRFHAYKKGFGAAQKNNKEWNVFTNTIGANNAEGWIMNLPFTARTENSDIYTIWYRGLKTAYTTKYSLLSTPGGDEVERSLWISVAKVEKSGYVTTSTINVIDGYSIFTIVTVDNQTSNPSVMDKYFKIDKISDFLYRLNILDERNLIKELPSGSFDFIPAFLSWAMDSKLNIESYPLLLPPDGTDTSDIFYYANGFNQRKEDSNPVTSFLLPYIELRLYIANENELSFHKRLIDKKNPLIVPNFRNTRLRYDKDFIDVYYSHSNVPANIKVSDASGSSVIYQYTQYMPNENEPEKESKYFDKDKEGEVWDTTALEVLFPIGIGSTIKSENFITPTVQLANDYSVRLYNKDNQTFLSFNISNRTYRGQAIFTIYGGNYTYDGQGIYYIGSGNDYSQSQFVCYALGLKFLANSGSEAYFYSPWEKRLFLFTGSNTLQAAESFSSLGSVKGSLFSSNEQALYLLFDKTDDDKNDMLLIKTPEDTGTLDVKTGGHLESSASGCVIVSGDGALKDTSSLAISPYNGDILPFNLETEYIGDDGMLYKVAYVDILLLDNNKDVNFDVTFNVINGIKKTEEVKHIELDSKDWKGTSYRYTFTPANMMGNSFKIGVKSNKELYISYIAVGLDDMSTNPTAPRTKGK